MYSKHAMIFLFHTFNTFAKHRTELKRGGGNRGDNPGHPLNRNRIHRFDLDICFSKIK
jgi:hypothetical protein